MPSARYKNMFDTLAIYEWAVTFHTAKMAEGGAIACPGPSLLYQI